MKLLINHCPFSAFLSLIYVVNVINLNFGLLVGQKKLFEDMVFVSGNLQ